MKRPRWYVRPGDDVLNPRTGRPYPPNHAVPRVAWHAQHAHTATEALVYDFLERRGQDIGGGRKKLTISRSRLARELKSKEWPKGLPVSTVRNCLRSLAAKHSIAQWNVETGRAQRRVRGDFGGVTTWLIPSWVEVLKVRRDDPAIGKVNKNCYVIGKGKRFLSPFEISAWKVDAAVAEKFSQAASPPPGEFGAPKGSAEPALNAPRVPPGAETPPAAAVSDAKPSGKPDLEPLRVAIVAACGEGSRGDAKKVWTHIHREAAGRPPIPDVAAACEMVADVGANWRHIGSGKPITPGLMARKVESRVGPWQAAQGHRRAADAKEAAYARDRRINALAEFLQDLDRPDLPDSDRAALAEAIASADADDLAIARSLVSRTEAAG